MVKKMASKRKTVEEPESNENKDKKMINKGTVAVLIIVAFIAFVSLIILLRQNQEDQANIGNKANVSIIIKQNTGKTMAECLSEYGINESIIYIYGDDCVYSQKNTPWVSKIKTEYNIRMINTKDTEELIRFMNCIGSFELEGTPTYVCLKNSQTHVGSFDSESEMNLFIAQCK